MFLRLLDYFLSYGCFHKFLVSHNGGLKMENPIKMDDLGVPLFSEPPIFSWNQLVIP